MRDQTAPVDMTKRIEMMVDNGFLSEQMGLAFRLTPPEPREAILAMDRPWEGVGSGVYGSVVSWRGRYHFYYRALPGEEERHDEDPGQFTCYAVSDDGISWEKPELGLVEFNGNRRNNILMRSQYSHNFSVFYDENPRCPEGERIKAVAGFNPDGVWGFVSADGLHFRKYAEPRIVTSGRFDTQNLAFYDTLTGEYRCYSRYIRGDDPSQYAMPGYRAKGVRAVQSSRSPDFVHFTEPVSNTYQNGEPAEHFYTSPTLPCPGAPHHYLAFPMRFMPERKKVEQTDYKGVSDNVFLSSRDGVHWDNRFEDSWMRPDRSERNWTQRNYLVTHGILPTSDGEFSVYATQHYYWDDCHIRRYSIRRHGFASLYGGGAGGTLTTVPFVFRGGELWLNYATAASGSIRAAVLDAETGQTVPGFGLADSTVLYGNEIWGRMGWQNGANWAALAGRPVRLRLELRLANLYAMRVE